MKRENETDDELWHRKDAIRDHSKEKVQIYIKNIMQSDQRGKSELKELLNPLCVIEALCDKENTANGFTFGNAQKLVNMTAKYMLYLCMQIKKSETYSKTAIALWME